MADSVRLNKHIAHTLGVSRREADIYIEQGRVTVNGKAAPLGTVVQPSQDQIQVDGTTMSGAEKQYTYLLFNKPVGYICSRRQQGDTPTIYKLLPPEFSQLKVAGRLDKDSCGLLLLTDDGDAIFKLTHPKFSKEKVYQVGLSRPLDPEDFAKINEGIMLEDGKSDMRVKPLKHPATQTGDYFYKVTMHEGRNRQIRRTFGGLRYTVNHLERTQFGPYALKQLRGQQFLQI